MTKKRVRFLFFFFIVCVVKSDITSLNIKIDNLDFWKNNKVSIEKCKKEMVKEKTCIYLDEDVIKIGDKYLQQFKFEEYYTYVIELNLEGQHIKIPYIKRKKETVIETSIGFTGHNLCNEEKNWNCKFIPLSYIYDNCKEDCSFISLDEKTKLYIEWY